MSDLRLLCVHPAGPHLGADHRLAPPEHAATLGRSSYGELIVDHDTIGRRHCELRVVDGAWTVRHLGCSSGTRVFRSAADARAFVNAIDRWENMSSCVLGDDDIVNTGALFFRVINDEGASAVLPHARLRLRLIDWLTGTLRADAFDAAARALPFARLVLVELDPPDYDDDTCGPRWLWRAASLVLEHAERSALVSHLAPATIGVATTSPAALETRLRAAFAGPWFTPGFDEQPLSTRIRTVELDSFPITPIAMSPALVRLALPTCPECDHALFVVDLRDATEQLVCRRCGGMFELETLAALRLDENC